MQFSWLQDPSWWEQFHNIWWLDAVVHSLVSQIAKNAPADSIDPNSTVHFPQWHCLYSSALVLSIPQVPRRLLACSLDFQCSSVVDLIHLKKKWEIFLFFSNLSNPLLINCLRVKRSVGMEPVFNRRFFFLIRILDASLMQVDKLATLDWEVFF